MPNNGNVKLVWLDVNSSYAHSSLALPVIEAQKRRTDVEWSVISATLSTPLQSLVSRVVAAAPDIIAVSVWLFTHRYVDEVLSRVARLLPETVIVEGGPEFLGDNEEYAPLRTYASVLFRGEAEETFHDWLDVYTDKSRWKTIPGLCYIDENGVYADNGLSRVADIAGLNDPQDSLFFNWEKPFVQLETARGCFNSCAFCVSGRDKPVRVLPLETVRRRIDGIANRGIRDIRLLDRTFNGSVSRAAAMLDLFGEYAGRLRFHLEVHPALLPPAVRERLRALPAGLLHLEAGIQSLREEVLQACGRVGSLEKSLEGLRFLASLDTVETHADLIAGLPLYSLEMIYGDVVTLAEIGVGEIQLELLKLLPGTDMRRRAGEWGIIYAPLPPYEVLRTPQMSAADLHEAALLSRLLDFYYNVPEWRPLFSRLIRKEKRFLHDYLYYLWDKDVLEQPLSMERRGMLLYDFCRTRSYETYLTDLSVAWVEAGLSLRKGPGASLVAYRGELPGKATAEKGTYCSGMRLYRLQGTETVYWFGYDRRQQHSYPVFRAAEPV